MISVRTHSRVLGFNRDNWITLLQFVVVLLVSIFIAYVASLSGVIIAILTLLFVIGITVLLISFLNIHIGFLLIFILSFFVLGITRYINLYDFPIGTLIDVQSLVVFIGYIIKENKFKKDFGNTAIGIFLIIFLVYNILEVVNPAAASQEAWFYAVRSNLRIVLLYFVLLFLLNDRRYISILIKTWIILVFLAALYCLYQEYVGFLPVEVKWLYADENRLNLYHTWGKFRKFSYFNSPMTLGLILSYTAVLCFALLFGPFKKRAKLLLGVGGAIMVWALFFTSTRTAYVVLPIGLVFFAVLTLKKQILGIIFMLVLIVAALAVMPTNNSAIFIFQTAFRGSEDASMNVRIQNQERIKPFIQSHPFGFGVGSTGSFGARFSPNSFIGSFPPDSQYVLIAIELGWLGLLFYMILISLIFRSGIKSYYRIRDKKLKFITAGVLSVFFMTMIAQYPQEATSEFPMDILFMACIALLVKMESFRDHV